MLPPNHPHRANAIIRRLWPAVVLAFGLGWAEEATASAVAPVPAVDADEHANHCKCRRCRGDSCCCGPRHAEPASAPAAPKAGSIGTGGGPCLGAIPCDDAGLPDAPVPGPSGKAASLTSTTGAIPVAAVDILPPDGRCVLPSPRASLLDEPPERTDLA